MSRRLSRRHALRRGESVSGVSVVSKQPNLNPNPDDNVIASEVRETVNTGPEIIADGKAMNPTTIAFASIASVACVALFIILGVYAYRSKKQKERQKRASHFDAINFVEKKDPFAFLPSHTIKVDLSASMRLSRSTLHPDSTASRPTTMSHFETGGYLNAPSTFKVTNGTPSPDTTLTTFLSIPSPVAEKQHGSRTKPKSLVIGKLAPGDLGISPPPSYNMTSGFGAVQDVFLPVPPIQPTEEKKLAMPPTPPATSKKLSLPPRRSSKDTVFGEHITVTSPIRSESFAAKDLEIPVSAETTSFNSNNGVDALPITLQSPKGKQPFGSAVHLSSDENPRVLRMMSVIATYKPNLDDELEVQIGDTVRVMRQYKDGWCVVQQVGKVDAPRGVVPLICLQERSRMVPNINGIHRKFNREPQTTDAKPSIFLTN